MALHQNLDLQVCTLEYCTVGSTELWTLYSLFLGGIIENQTSDFVTVPGYRAQ